MPALINAPNGMQDGMNIMQQHILNRDYKLSRKVIDQLASWNDQQPGAYAKRQTLEEFANDPLGEKRKMLNIQTLNNALKTEVYEHKISKEKAKNFCKQIGLDGEKE